MEFNIGKFVGDAQQAAGAFINRAKQMSSEVIYSSEKTNLDPQLEALCKQADEARNWTQKIVKDTESVLTPNPGQRVEDFVLEKIDKKRPPRMSNMEVLGQGMLEAGNDFGPTAAYGSMLIKVGTSELKLGQTEREFINVAVDSFVDPLNRFLDNEVKNATKERKTLEMKRLDLDAAKNKLRKARSMSSMPTKDGTDPRVLIQQAEQEVIQAQAEFNQQGEITKVQLEVLMASRDRLVENLKSFVQAQTTYFARCHQLMLDLNKDLVTMPLSSVNLAQSFSIDDSMLDDSLGTNGIQMKVKVMYDYVARNPDEISVFANETFNVTESKDSDYYVAHKGSSSGKIPKACVLLV
ncbi:endophilin-B1-like [Folsomia candida]|uniref:endophilin-B1-like n=1 Tax=Folsomia candida TaxID=158441 RepID=UPI000B904F5E|nr:endophilin-B1-like [Folsomia candida]